MNELDSIVAMLLRIVNSIIFPLHNITKVSSTSSYVGLRRPAVCLSMGFLRAKWSFRRRGDEERD